MSCIINNSIQQVEIKFNRCENSIFQGKQIERIIFILPPKEAKTDKLWCLRMCVYGLADASRYWCLRVKEELAKSNGLICPTDQGIFVWYHNNKFNGIIICFVDDIIWGGTGHFDQNVIQKFRNTFKIGSENTEFFIYLGLNIKQNTDYSIDIDQNNYINGIQPIPLTSERVKCSKEPLTDSERSQYRQLIGQLNWVTNMTRPEFSFETCYARTTVNSATVSDVIKLNKVLRQIKSTESHIKFPSLDIKSISVKTYTDASFNNLPHGGSQGGQLVFITDKEHRSCPIAWNSSKIKLIVRSMLAAETLSLTDGCDTSFYVTQIVNHVYQQNFKNTMITDNKSPLDSIQTTSLINDKRLRVELSALPQMYDRDEIEIEWTPTSSQIINVLTKRGAAKRQLTEILETGQLPSIN